MVEIDSKLKNDTVYIGDFKLSEIRLMNNSLFPWIVLVPKIKNAKEIIDLEVPDRILLMEEISIISDTMQKLFNPDKLNIASLGNIVSQLHIHVVSRYKTDSCWPDPVWGRGSKPYSEDLLRDITEELNRSIL